MTHRAISRISTPLVLNHIVQSFNKSAFIATEKNGFNLEYLDAMKELVQIKWVCEVAKWGPRTKPNLF